MPVVLAPEALEHAREALRHRAGSLERQLLHFSGEERFVVPIRRG
ncbi:MAG TPA: hypothetical protein VKK30_05305 [Actinomycetota bacterium]|nr:hypothetical protein [Actinomycetota bacterium]